MKKLTYAAATLALCFGIITLNSCGSSEEPKEQSTTTEEATEETTEEVVEETTTEESTISGEELFTSNGCVACHQAETKTVGPALKEIAEAYTGNEDGLKAFLNGEGDAIVDPAQAAVMAPQTDITKKMSDEERAAIAKYILEI